MTILTKAVLENLEINFSKFSKKTFRYAKRFRIFAITLQRQTTENCSLKKLGGCRSEELLRDKANICAKRGAVTLCACRTAFYNITVAVVENSFVWDQEGVERLA